MRSLWANSISCACIICTLIEGMLPRGKISKAVENVLGIFTLAVMILPLSQSNFSIKMKYFISDLQKNHHEAELKNKTFIKKINTEIEENISKTIEKIIRKSLIDINIRPKKIEILFKKDDHGENIITEINCKIFIKKDDFEKSNDIKNHIWNNLQIHAEVKSFDEKK